MDLATAVAEQIERVTGAPFALRERTALGGGCINAVHRISDGERRFLLKTNRAALAEMFAAEAEALAALAAAGGVRVPQPVAHGVTAGEAYLVLEYLELGGAGDLATLGSQLAAQHRVTAARFGWHRDNFIGATPQANGWVDEWVPFWRDRRLAPQLERAGRNGIGRGAVRDGEALMARLPALFGGYRPLPSLLHGDLWSGNAATLRDGTPVVFDPATYYGDRETDIAMTELFGGFGGRFHAAYDEAWPLDAGYPVRKTLYNLYHVLNHFNLFGGGYGGQAAGLIGRLLSELR
jgi:protein-ribulosamine 3-kinase